MKISKKNKPIPGPAGPVGPMAVPFDVGAGDPDLAYTQTTVIGSRYLNGTNGNLWERVVFANQFDDVHLVLPGNLTWKKIASLRGPAGQNLQLLTKNRAAIDNTKNEVLEGTYDFDGTGPQYANFISLRSADGTKGGQIAITENYKVYFLAPQPAGYPSFWNEIVVKDLSSYGYRFSQAVMLPKLTTAQINALPYPEEGHMVYNTTLDTICFYNGAAWKAMAYVPM